MTQLTIHTFKYKDRIFAFNLHNRQIAIRNVGLLVDNQSFTWYDAAKVTQQIRNIG